MEAFGKCAEMRSTVNERNDFTVEEHVVEEGAECLELWEGHGDVPLSPAEGAHVASADVEKDAHSVPLEFMDPVRADRDVPRRRREHREHRWGVAVRGSR